MNNHIVRARKGIPKWTEESRERRGYVPETTPELRRMVDAVCTIPSPYPPFSVSCSPQRPGASCSQKTLAGSTHHYRESITDIYT